MSYTQNQSQCSLIITADDFGYSAERDDGILECFLAGAITNASLMVNGYSALSAVEKAKAVNMPLGLHLNLTEGLPIGDRPYRTLVGGDGFMLGKMGFRESLQENNTALDEVQTEIQCQIDKFTDLTGHRPLKVDGHQHVHVIPGIRNVFAKVLHDNGIIMSRLPIEVDVAGHQWQSWQQQQFMKEVVKQSIEAKSIYGTHGIWAPGFVGLTTMGHDMNVTHLQTCIMAAFKSGHDNKIILNEVSIDDTVISDGVDIDFVNVKTFESKCTATGHVVVELMVHPGKRTGESGGCGNGPDEFARSPYREHEMAILKCCEMLEFYRRNNIHLVANHSVLF